MKALQVLAFVASTWSGILDANGLPEEAAVLSERSEAPAPKREALPKGLQTIRPDHLSPGALRLLDQNGNLVHWPVGARRSLAGAHSNAFSGEINSRTNVAVRLAAPEPTPVAAAASDPAILAGLDPRVGSNLRLGNDPSQLPSSLRAQAEPHIARSPTNPDLLAATFQEGRFTDGGAVDCGYAISHDGGLSWSRALIPGLTAIVGGPYYRVSDPVAGIDLKDFVYLNTIGLLDSSLTTSAVLLNRSTNGGASFEPPVEAMRSTDSSVLLDKNW